MIATQRSLTVHSSGKTSAPLDSTLRKLKDFQPVPNFCPAYPTEITSHQCSVSSGLARQAILRTWGKRGELASVGVFRRVRAGANVS